jgi:hypothetical protein
MALLADSAAELATSLLSLEAQTQKWGLTISVPKTKLMCIQHHGCAKLDLPVVELRGEVVEWVSKFKYLGTIISADGSVDADVHSRVAKAYGLFSSLRPILLNQAISLSTRLLFFKAFIPPTLTYGCECWALTAPLASKLDAAYMSFLRAMLGVKLLDKVPNLDVLQCCRTLPITSTISRHRMRWLGHLARMDLTTRLPSQILQGRLPEASRPPGHPATAIAHGYRDDVAAMSSALRAQTGDGFHQRRGENRTFWAAAIDRDKWKGLTDAAWPRQASLDSGQAGT